MKLILITGAAGKTGRIIIQAIASRQVAVRALVHRATQTEVVCKYGAMEVAVGDLLNEADVAKAMMGINFVYHICPNVHPDEITIAQTVIRAALHVGVERFVYHSVLHPQTEKMPHHWKKMRVEELLFETSLPYTILQPSIYMQNILAGWDRIKNEGVHSVPYGIHSKLNMVDLENVGETAARVLLEGGHLGATYELAGPENLTQLEVAQVLTRELGKPIRARSVSLDVWGRQARNEGMGSYQVDTLVKMFEYYDAYGMQGNSNVLARLLGRPPHTFSKFIRRHIDKQPY